MKSNVRLLMICWIVLTDSAFGQTVTINKAVLTSSNHQVETTTAINPTNKYNLISGAISCLKW
jgi:hypothetical protein